MVERVYLGRFWCLIWTRRVLLKSLVVSVSTLADALFSHLWRTHDHLLVSLHFEVWLDSIGKFM